MEQVLLLLLFPYKQHTLPRMPSYDCPPVAQGTHLDHQVFVTTCFSFPSLSRVHE